MALKLIKIAPKPARIVIIAAAVLCLAATWFFIRWNFANAVATRIDLRQPDSRPIVQLLVDMAGSDPQTHYAAALLLEKTFDPGDLDRSLGEYESAAALSPHNYLYWISLGQARSVGGDIDGAEAAYARALELAPNYAAVQWAYGNFLVRQGKTDEGFALVARAAAANPIFSQPAVTIALQIFDGDLTQVRKSLGDTDITNIALMTALLALERYEESFDAWSKIPAEKQSSEFIKLGEKLAEQMASAKNFQLAARIYSQIQIDEAARPKIGQIFDGSFENGVKQKGANIFEWQIAEGGEPQIGLSDTHKRTGKYGLFVLFNTNDTADFRTISQTIAVVPGVQYELELFYRSDLKTSAVFKWEIADAATTGTIASTAPMVLAGDWATLKTVFTVPAAVDGIVVRLAREGCIGPSCRVSGRLSFDDFSLRRL